MNPTIIDDRDPKITYTPGTWNRSGTPNEYHGTVSSSINVGDHFSVPFNGTSISVYGTFNSSSAGVKTSYKIDGGPIITVPSDSSAKDRYQQLFWQSNPLRTGPHTLLVAMVAVNDKAETGEGTVWFDYFKVTHAGSPPKKASHAALIGGVTAGAVVLIIALGLLFLYLRRRKRKYESTPSAPSTTPLPFPATMAESGPPLAASSGVRGRPNPSSGVPETADTHTPAPPSYGPSESAASQSQNHGLGTSSTADDTEHFTSIADLKRRQQQVVSSYNAGRVNGGNAHAPTPPIQHVDSGMRELAPAAESASVPVELPPAYTAA
ncbi:hypothetical protein DFH08DRAFT_1088807 [Mycena albidolilacea]|uniref:Transmembrane protein n=1 Tax=Mycena albidolilacea TaxID=1033008 RepID=A0AAD6Z589_9AGAR|nr:hypothetical protein DFH08DRAFT_1088807 [Mycena albidolilacea]